MAKRDDKVVDVEMKRLLNMGFKLRGEIEGLEKRLAGKVKNRKDKGTRMSPLPVGVGVGVQAEMPEVSEVSMQTDISHVQVVWEATYASVASQAGSGEVRFRSLVAVVVVAVTYAY